MENKTKSEKVSKVAPDQTLLPQAELWQSFYALAQHWQSDLKFFEDELNFFTLLIDKNLSILIEPKNIEQTRIMVSHVQSLEREREALYKKISRHVQHIVQLVENPFALDSRRYKAEHANLENVFADFMKSFRSIKSEVFKLNERAIHSEKVKRIIDWA